MRKQTRGKDRGSTLSHGPKKNGVGMKKDITKEMHKDAGGGRREEEK